MNLDERGRHAAQAIRSSVEVMQMSAPVDELRPGSVERLDRHRDRRDRNRKIGAAVLALAVVAGLVVGGLAVLDRGQGEQPAEQPITAGNVASLRQIGLVDTGGMTFRMATEGNLMVVGGGDEGDPTQGWIGAYRLPCGGQDDPCAPLWTAKIDGWATPAIDGDLVFATGLRGTTLYAFDASCATGGSTCEPRWTARAGEMGAPTGPIPSGGSVYVGTSSGLVAYPRDCSSPCRPSWSVATDRPVRAITVAGDVVFAGTGEFGPPDSSDRGSVYGIRLDELGRAPWHQPVGQVWSITVSGDGLLVGTNGGLTAFDRGCADNLDRCAPLWTTSTACCTAVTAADDGIVLHDHIRSVMSVPMDCPTGGASCDPSWTSASQLSGDPYVDFDTPTVTSDLVFVGGEAGTIYAYPRSCDDPCQSIWQGMGQQQSGDAAVVGSRLYVAATDGIHVFEPDDSAATGA